MSQHSFSIICMCMLAISISVIYAQKDGRYRPVATVATKKPLFPILGRYNTSQNDGKYYPNEDGKYRGNEDGKYHASSEGKYTNSNKGNYKPAKNVKTTGASKQKDSTRSKSFANGAKLRRNFIRAIPTKASLPSLPSGRGSSAGRNDFKIVYLSKDEEIDGYHYVYETENGILAEEEGRIVELPTGEGLRTTGFFEYTGDDGSLYRVDYVADDAGFVPQGAHIHPTPPHVIKLLKYLALNANKKK